MLLPQDCQDTTCSGCLPVIIILMLQIAIVDNNNLAGIQVAAPQGAMDQYVNPEKSDRRNDVKINEGNKIQKQ